MNVMDLPLWLLVLLLSSVIIAIAVGVVYLVYGIIVALEKWRNGRLFR